MWNRYPEKDVNVSRKGCYCIWKRMSLYLGGVLVYQNFQSNTPAFVSSTKNNININTMEKIIKILTTKALILMEHQWNIDGLNNIKNMLIPILLKFFELVNIKK